MKKMYLFVCFLTIATNCFTAEISTDAEIQLLSEFEKPTITIVEDSAVQLAAEKYFLCMQGAYRATKGDLPGALASNQKLLKLTQDPEAHEGLLRILFETQQYAEMVKIILRNEASFLKIFNKNLEMQLIIAQAFLNTDQDAKAEILFLKLVEKYPDDEQVAYYTAVAHLKNKQFDKGNKFIEKCLNNKNLKSKHFLFHFLKSKLYLQNNNPQKALCEIEKSIKLFPSFDRGWLFKAMLLEQEGKIGDAINGYKRVLDLIGRDASVEQQLVQLLFSQQRFNEALDLMERMKSDKPEHFCNIAFLNLKKGDYKIALHNINKALEKEPKLQKALLLKVEVLLAMRDTSSLLTFMTSWIKQSPNDISALHTLLLLRQADIPLDSLIKIVQEAQKTNPRNILLLATLADLYTEAEKFKEGLETYKKLKEISHDEELQQQIDFQIAYNYFVTDQPQKVEETLRPIIKQETPYAPSCNLLAYQFALTNQNLETAIMLINKALQSNPSSPHYLDTKGVILLKQDKKEEAILLFQKALSLAPTEQEITEHLQSAINLKEQMKVNNNEQ
jgi:tetratricopeptide (TPR) repeat protein